MNSKTPKCSFKSKRLSRRKGRKIYTQKLTSGIKANRQKQKALFKDEQTLLTNEQCFFIFSTNSTVQDWHEKCKYKEQNGIKL
ncbi:MAG TPA: hypothetical protein GX526_04610 [Thermoanaerobacterales bacterium]|nr:hypothetical protein [Thermoanaerobacterales bacterium]